MRLPDRTTKPGRDRDATRYTVHDADRRRRRRGIAVLVLLLITPLIAAQAAFGFPLDRSVLPDLGGDEPAALRSSTPDDERQDQARGPKRHPTGEAHALPTPPDDPTLSHSLPRLGL